MLSRAPRERPPCQWLLGAWTGRTGGDQGEQHPPYTGGCPGKSLSNDRRLTAPPALSITGGGPRAYVPAGPSHFGDVKGSSFPALPAFSSSQDCSQSHQGDRSGGPVPAARCHQRPSQFHASPLTAPWDLRFPEVRGGSVPLDLSPPPGPPLPTQVPQQGQPPTAARQGRRDGQFPGAGFPGASLTPCTQAQVLLVPRGAPQLFSQSRTSIALHFSTQRPLTLPKHLTLAVLRPSPHPLKTGKITILVPQPRMRSFSRQSETLPVPYHNLLRDL